MSMRHWQGGHSRPNLIADYSLSHPWAIAAYQAAVQTLPQVEHRVIPMGTGLSLADRQTGNEDTAEGVPV
jgi:hypothetical protein